MDRAWRDLASHDTPAPDDEWGSIGLPFAMGLNGYAHAGGAAQLAELSERVRAAARAGRLAEVTSADALRAALFKLARDEHFGADPPSEAEPEFYTALLQELRRRKQLEESVS